MPKLVAIGETIYDIIFLENRPVAGSPGGAMLNSAVSLGRTGLDVHLVSELGDDALGKIIKQFLEQNGVKTEFLNIYPEMKTPVSVAVLDERMNASYTFYKNYPEERLIEPLPEVSHGDVILFGSFYSLDGSIRKKLVPWLSKARVKGGIIIYDPNIRKNHVEEARSQIERVSEHITTAHIVRGSDEDFENLFGFSNPKEVYQRAYPDGNGIVVITRNKNGVDIIRQGYERHYETPAIQVVSTIGAGDAFNAGLAFGLMPFLAAGYEPSMIPSEDLDEIIRTGITFATNACQSFENYISQEMAEIFRRIVEISKSGA